VGEVFEAVLAEVACLNVDEVSRRLGEDDLAPVCGGRDTRRPVHVESHVAAADDQGLPGVNAHSHVDAQPDECALSGGCRVDGVGRAVERIEKRVALCVDLATGAERFTQPLTLALEGLRVRVRAELGEQLRGSFDVGEDKRDGAARQLGHTANSRSWTVARR